MMKWFTKINGGKHQLKNRKESNSFISQISKLANHFTKKLKFLRSTNCGSVLVEFAIYIPILIVLVFCIIDVVKIRRYYSQTKFVGQQMANILQNLAEKRNAEENLLSKTDLSHAASLAFLTIYPGTTQYSRELKHIPSLACYYTKGSTREKARCIWGKGIRSGTAESPPWNDSRSITSKDSRSKVVYSSTDVSYSSIYPTLRVDAEKVKIILEVMINWDSSYKDSNGNNALTSRGAFGLHFIAPRSYSSSYFNSVVIFAPNAGFPPTEPV
ncbi:MAG: pilus assembly protein [Alphaproteobacteria bacterium]|nr:pilus assembly protein [Alphaproteobacteria bacterium]